MKSIIFVALAGIVMASPLGDVRSTSLHYSTSAAMAHGDPVTVGGKVWLLHDRGDGIFVGVEPEKWHDTELYLVDDDPSQGLPGSRTKALTTHNNTSELSERDLQETCRYVLACVVLLPYHYGSMVYSGIMTGLTPLINYLGSLALSASQNPTFANFVGVGGQNWLITLWTEHKSSPQGTSVDMETCSTQLSQDDLLQALVLKACAGNPTLGSFKVDLTYPDGSSLTLHLSAGAGTIVNGSDVCQAAQIF